VIISTEYYKFGMPSIFRLICNGPYETKEEADKDGSLYWTIDRETISVSKYHPEITKIYIYILNIS
jgi:hypothetical protein